MSEWDTLVNDLETGVPPLDETAAARIRQRVRAALPRRRKRRWFAALLAAVLVLTACGYAAVTGQFSQWFWNLADRDAPEADEDLLASMGTVIGQSQTVDGVTATLHGAIWDGESLVLSLTLEGEGVPTDYWTDVQTEDSWLCATKAQTKRAWLDAYPDADEAELDARLDAFWETIKRWRHGDITYLYDRQTQAYTLQVLRDYTAPLDSAELELHLENLEFQDAAISGPFDFTFTVERRFPETVYEGSALLEQEDGPALHITKVSLTPLQVKVDFAVLEPMAYSQYHAGGITASVSGIYTGGELSYDSYYIGRSSTLATRDENGAVTGTLRQGPFRQVVDPSTVTGIVLDNWLLDLETFTLSPLPA